MVYSWVGFSPLIGSYWQLAPQKTYFKKLPWCLKPTRNPKGLTDKLLHWCATTCTTVAADHLSALVFTANENNFQRMQSLKECHNKQRTRQNNSFRPRKMTFWKIHGTPRFSKNPNGPASMESLPELSPLSVLTTCSSGTSHVPFGWDMVKSAL